MEKEFRDEIAIEVLKAFLANPKKMERAHLIDDGIRILADDAYEIADAMMEARKK